MLIKNDKSINMQMTYTLMMAAFSRCTIASASLDWNFSSLSTNLYNTKQNKNKKKKFYKILKSEARSSVLNQPLAS